MRSIFSVLSLLAVLLLVAVLAKKLLTSGKTVLPVSALPTITGPDDTPVQSGTRAQESLQPQYKQAIENAMQAPRHLPDDQ